MALIVVWVSFEMGAKSIHALMDKAPEGMEGKIKEAVEAMPEIADCHHVRVRCSGSQLFVDVHVLVDGNQTLTQAHALTERIEQAIQTVAPASDVTVHPEPI